MTINIIQTWNEVEKYIEAVENGADRKEQWEKIVIEPYWEKLCCYAPMDLSERKPGVIQDIDKLKEQVKILKNLDICKLKVSFEKVVDILPNYDDDPITIALFPLDTGNRVVNEKQNGVVGTSLFGNLMIQINPFVKDYESWIPYVFAHEYHHTVWGNYWFMLHAGSLENKLIDSLIIDGEADSFALSLYPDLKPKWIFDIPKEEVCALWNTHYKDNVLKRDMDYVKYMFGKEEEGIPWCAGYAIGYMLVQQYLKETGETILDILEKKPEDILKGSKF